MLIKKNDTVVVRIGKNRGQKGKVLSINREKSLITVEGVNEVFRHVKPSQKNMRGGRISKYMPIQISNVMLVCPVCGKPVRLGVKFDNENKKVRFCKKCEAIIPVIVDKKVK